MENETNMPLDLNLDLNDTDTSYPMLPASTFEMVVKDLEMTPSKAVEGGFNLKVSFATVNTETTIGAIKAGKQDDQAPGLVITRYYPLQANPNGSENFDYKQGLAELQDATQGTEQGARPKFSPATCKGVHVHAKVKAEKGDEQYGPSNSIGSLSFIKPAA